MKLLDELRYSSRCLLRTPSFTVFSTSGLAVGIAAAAVLFTLTYQITLRPLSFPNASRLVRLFVSSEWPGTGLQRSDWSYPFFGELGERARSLERVAAFQSIELNMENGDSYDRVRGELVSSAFLPLLGVSAALGRAPEPGSSAALEVALSDALWERRFGRSPGILGATLRLEGVPATIVGVFPKDFRGLSGSVDVWASLDAAPHLVSAAALESPWNLWLQVIGLYREDAGLDAVSAELAALLPEIAAGYPLPVALEVKWSAEAIPLRRSGSDPKLERALKVLCGAVACLLALVTVNFASLLALRNRSRETENAVRVALGASARRLAVTATTEGVLLAVAGAVLGAILAAGVLRFLDVEKALSRMGADLPISLLDPAAARQTGLVLLFAAGIALAIGVAAGLLSAVRVVRRSVSGGLASLVGGVSQRSTAAQGRHRAFLVVVQVSLAVVLVAGATVLSRSLGELLRVDPGFAAGDTVTFRVAAERSQATSSVAGAQFISELLDRVRAVPGIAQVSVDRCAPLSSSCPETLVTYLEPRGALQLDSAPRIEWHAVAPDHFAMLDVPVRAGRTFGPGDVAGAPLVAVLNATAARSLFADADALGRRLALALSLFRGNESTAEVVGVVGDVLYGDPSEPTKPAVYLAARQFSSAAARLFVSGSDAASVDMASLRRAVAATGSGAALYQVQPLEEVLGEVAVRPRLTTALLSAFAFASLTLAIIGVCGLVDNGVRLRQRELALRYALGAGRRQIFRQVVMLPFMPVAFGVLLGAVGANFALPTVLGLVGELDWDGRSFIVLSSALLVISVVVATVVSAVRVFRIDPAVSLRNTG